MKETARITVMVENTAGSGVLAEHGYSLLLEIDGKRVLLDTGAGRVLADNARILGVSFDSLNALVLSHGHYDHTGGTGTVLTSRASATTGRLPVFVHPSALEKKYSRKSGGLSREIGFPEDSRIKVRELADIRFTEKPTEVVPGVYASGAIPRETVFEDTGGPFYLDPECSRPDPLVDDQAVYFSTDDGIVVLLSCAHAGVINTLRYIIELNGNKPVHTVIGGMHLHSADARRIDETVTELRKLGLRKLYPLHCTGFAASARFWNEFPGSVATVPAGTVIRIH